MHILVLYQGLSISTLRGGELGGAEGAIAPPLYRVGGQRPTFLYLK